jgi:predicted  nucleic acid-binding Zn-ribbon protein
MDRHQSDLARIPREVQAMARNLVTLRREISEAESKLESVEKDLRRKEQELATEQEKIKRSERRLLNIRNIKEHNALSREVKLGKKVASEIEDAILDCMAEIEGLKGLLEKKQRDYDQLEKTLLEKKAEAGTVETEATSALDKLQSEKEHVTGAIELEFLKRYRMIRKVRGYAMAELKNGSCSGCHMAIPPQINIRVFKQEEIVSCPSCHRLLFARPENIPDHNRIDAD